MLNSSEKRDAQTERSGIAPRQAPPEGAPGKIPYRDGSRAPVSPLREEGGPVRRNGDGRQAHAVIIVENMTVPHDRRVWQQARALRDDGWRVTVITPQTQACATPREQIEGIEIRRHPLALEARGVAGYALEYASALWGEATRLLALGPSRIDVVQICNPPDFLFAPALIAKAFGARIVFDHHDLTPELLVEKLGRERHPLISFAKWAERRTFTVADRVISTNAAFARRALGYGKARGDVDVVYSSPDLARIPPTPPDPSLKRGKEHLLLWVGVMGSQDGLDLLLDAAAALRAGPMGPRFHLLLAGDGPERESAERRMRALGLKDCVEFAGFLSGRALASAFASADIGVASDPKNPFNDRLAMNKVMEYMAHALPIAMFDLVESGEIAGEAAFRAANNDPGALAARIEELMGAPARRQRMGATGFARLQSHYGWAQQRARYLSVYRDLLEMTPS